MKTPKDRLNASASVTIDKNIPIPPKPSPKPSILKQMEVMDSVLVTPKQATYLRGQAKKFGMKIEVRTEGKKRRVWRTK